MVCLLQGECPFWQQALNTDDYGHRELAVQMGFVSIIVSKSVCGQNGLFVTIFVFTKVLVVKWALYPSFLALWFGDHNGLWIHIQLNIQVDTFQSLFLTQMSMNVIPVHAKWAVYVWIVKAHTRVNVRKDGEGRTVRTVSHGAVSQSSYGSCALLNKTSCFLLLYISISLQNQ